MANSVVKVTDVTDDMLNDSLLLLVGEDGTVTPDKETVETYLNSKSGPTNIQIMHIDKADPKSIDVTVDNVVYMPSESANSVEGAVIKSQEEMDEVARNLYNFKLDHDYTPLTSPRRPSASEDELTKTLSILHGSENTEKKAGTNEASSVNSNKKSTSSQKINIISSVTIPPMAVTTASSSVHNSGASVATVTTVGSNLATPFSKGKAKFKTSLAPTKPAAKIPKKKAPKKIEEVEDDSDNYEEDEDFDIEMEDDDNDSDFDIEEEVGKVKQPRRRPVRRRTKSESKPTAVKAPRVTPKAKLKREHSDVTPKIEKKEEKDDKTPDKTSETKPETQETKVPEKKPPKKEKKPPKPIPDDFALFSTPDIIRRVGGKEPVTPTSETPGTPKSITKANPDPQIITLKTPKTPQIPQTEIKKASEEIQPEAPTTPKPAKITQEARSKSNSESSPHSSNKHQRQSLDNKEKERHFSQHRTSTESKSKDRRLSTEVKTKRTSSLEEKFVRSNSSSSSLDSKVSEGTSRGYKTYGSPTKPYKSVHDILETIPTPQEIRSIIMPEEPKSYPSSNVSDLNTSSVSNLDSNGINLDGSGLDLDQSILDNINNDDVISEDILYQVAQQLVSNTELQNAIDKGINEGVLDTSSIQDALDIHTQMPQTSVQAGNNIIKEGTQIVRPDGRVVVIPPIERPSTRSRNKKKNDPKLPFKSVHKPLDEEHVSGNELDSSNDEEESEDDPNKLWCICNQPHNNRFMICCDTCEEWYHGKCVNITKAMGQQMESEGKEWICLFCKDPSLKRPMAAARRIRKASRNSRASTDSSNSSSKQADSSPTTSVPCVVCQKPSRKSSIYCSESCILAHAQGIERVVVFERATGNMITGSKGPSAANLDQWLKEHPGYEVVRSAGKVVTAKIRKHPSMQPRSLIQSKLKLVKNPNDEGVSLAVHQRGTSIGILKHSPKLSDPKTIKVLKIISKNPNVHSKEPKAKLIQPQPVPAVRPPVPPPQVKVKNTVQTLLSPKIPKPKENVQKEKPMPTKTPKSRQQPLPLQQQETPQPKEENIRENVQKTVFEQLLVRLKGVEDLKLTDDEVKNISTDVETQLYKCFGDTGQKYRNKYRSLIFNIKDSKNQTLWRRICEKSISPYELVRLSPDDMASQELAMWREREAKHQLDMIKKSELELLSCNRQYVLKTHKGEQVLEDGRPDKVDNAEVIKSLTEGSTLDSGEKEKRDHSKEKDKDKKSTSKHTHKDRDRDRKSSRERKDKDHRSRRSSSRDKDRDRDRSRKRSKSRDRYKHSERKKDKRSRSRSRDRDRHRKSSHKSSRHKKHAVSSTDKLDKKSKEILEQLVDNKIVPPLEDRLWEHVPQEDITQGTAPADSDSDHEPSSTVTIPTPPRSQDSDEPQPMSQSSNDSKTSSIDKPKEVIEAEERTMSPVPKSLPAPMWKGVINMVDVAQISITAQEVSGDCIGLGKELPGNLEIVGRISPETVWDYIGKMRCSNSKMISLIRLTAINIEEQMPYLALYSYLSSRNRLGVVKSPNKAVKDFYVLPLSAQKPIPQALLPINGPGFEESRPALLLGIIVRDKRKRPYTEPATTPAVSHKKTKVEVAVTIVPPTPPTTTPARSYTPPPVPVPPPQPVTKVDPRLSKLPMPPPVAAAEDDGGDEPYSPEDSDLDVTTPPRPSPAIVPPLPTEPIVIPEPPSEENENSSTYPVIPGLGDAPGFLSSRLDLQRQMEELNKKIEMQKSEITSITQNIATASSSDIGTSALASIALPSNLQQILDSIKTIGVPSSSDGTTTVVMSTTEIIAPPGTIKTDLTIPLMIPKTFTRPLNNSPSAKVDVHSDTIPLNLPGKFKAPPPKSSYGEADKSNSLLSTLSEDDLIKKAAEMLKHEEDNTVKKKVDVTSTPPPTHSFKSHSPKKAKMDVYLPPVPGVDD